MTKILSKKHGIFVGISAGANIFASIEISKKCYLAQKLLLSYVIQEKDI